MAEYFEKEALIREIISDMASFVGDPDAVQKHDEQCNYAISCIESATVSDVAPVVHARWIARNDKGIISMTHPYMCSRCWRVEMDKEPYCNCGAKMDGGADNG
jgi:hypothetical protein